MVTLLRYSVMPSGRVLRRYRASTLATGTGSLSTTGRMQRARQGDPKAVKQLRSYQTLLPLSNNAYWDTVYEDQKDAQAASIFRSLFGTLRHPGPRARKREAVSLSGGTPDLHAI